jgi:hypothetical protein
MLGGCLSAAVWRFFCFLRGLDLGEVLCAPGVERADLIFVLVIPSGHWRITNTLGCDQSIRRRRQTAAPVQR